MPELNESSDTVSENARNIGRIASSESIGDVNQKLELDPESYNNVNAGRAMRESESEMTIYPYGNGGCGDHGKKLLNLFN
ncbi:hypothetical protein L6164_015499 [Bauhinia variegata]|nr:hypothetical protein L6164_015499 [Bauhinia variegata]